MKQRKSKQVRLFSGMLIGIVMIAVLARIVYLNHCYPSPKVITYTENDTIKLGNYEIKQTGWEWGDGAAAACCAYRAWRASSSFICATMAREAWSFTGNKSM